jgi:hypothetical protein
MADAAKKRASFAASPTAFARPPQWRAVKSAAAHGTQHARGAPLQHRHCEERKRRPVFARAASYAGFESADLASPAEALRKLISLWRGLREGGSAERVGGSNPERRLRLDCFAELVIGPATSGRTRWLAMTSCVSRHPEVRAERASKDERPGPSPFEGRFAATSG